MKKLKLLLLALAVIALIVAGITVTVSADAVADTTILTVNGEEYDAVPESIPNNAVVLGYKPCVNVPYNPTATYKLANEAPATTTLRIACLVVNEADGLVHFGGANPHAANTWSSSTNITAEMLTSDKEGDITVTIYSVLQQLPFSFRANYVLKFAEFNQAVISGGKISFNQNSTLSFGNSDVIIGLKTRDWSQNASAKTATLLTPPELPYSDYSNVKVPEGYGGTKTITLKALDKTTGYYTFGNVNTNVEYTDDTVVTIGALDKAFVYKSNATYVLADGLDRDYEMFTSTHVLYGTYGENGANLKTSFTNSAESVKITLYKDFYAEGTGCFSALGSTSTKSFYLDLNGYDFTYRCTQNPTGNYSSSFSSMFALIGNVDTYIVSSQEGGTLTFYNKHYNASKDPQVYESSHALFYPVANAKITIGGTTIDGEKIDGDNLSVYAGGLFAFTNGAANVKANVNGAYFYAIGDASQGGAITFGYYGQDTVISYTDAKIYSESGKFISTYGSAASSAVYNFDNCVLYSPGTGAFNMHPGATINISNSYLPVTAHITGDNINASIDNCYAPDISTTTAGRIQYNVDLSDSIVKSFDGFKKPQFAYNEASGKYEVSPVDLGAITYKKWIGNVAYKNNITLTADIVYSLYVPTFVDSVTINGKEYTAKRYNDYLNVVSISVGAKNMLDEMVVSASFGAQTENLTVKVMDYVDNALKAYSDDVHLVGVLNAVKDYSKAASAYFGYNVEAFTYEYFNTLLAKAEGDGRKMDTPTASFLAKITGAKLRLNNEIAFVFGVAENATGEVSVSYYYNNKLVNKTVSLDGKSEIVIPVKAIDLNKGVTLTVGEDTLNYNLQNYIYNTAKKTGLDNYAALMLLLSHMDNYAESACYGHVAGDPITANYTVLKTESGCYSYDSVYCCVNCGKVMNSEPVIHAHGETKTLIANEIPVEAFKDGSYDSVVACSVCEYAISTETVTLPSLMSYFTYIDNDDDTYTVTGVTELGAAATEIIVPDCVSEITNGALAKASSVVSITLPFVGKNATTSDQAEGCFGYIFGASTYTDNNTTVPKTLKNVTVTAANKIAANAFRLCQSLTGTIIFNEGITSIGGTAFYQAPITTVIIPKSVTSIGSQSFAITSMNLKVYYLGTEEQWTTKLKPGAQTGSGKDYFRLEEKVYANVAYPANIFFSVPETPVLGATYWTMIDGVPTTYVFDGTIPHDQHIPAEPVVENEIPAGCNGGSYESVVYCSVYGCNHVISRTTVYTDPVHTPAEAVKENVVPTSPTVAGSYDLVVYCSGCGTELSKTTETIPTYSSDFTYAQNEDGTWAVTGLSESGAALTAVVIPDGITAIAENAFKDNKIMTSVVIPTSVKSIGAYAFSASTITNVVVPSSVTSMGTAIFYQCKKLVTVDIQANIETLPSSTLRECTELALAILPEGLKYIDGNYAFTSTSAAGMVILPSTFVKFNGGSGTYQAVITFAYAGTEEEWNAKVGKPLTSWQGNVACTSTLLFYSESAPTDDGNYWHYVDGNATAWADADDREAMAPFLFTVNSDGTYNIIGVTEEGKAMKNLVVPNIVSQITLGALAGINAESLSIPFVGQRANHVGNLIFGYIFGATTYGEQNALIPTTLKNLTITGGTKIGNGAFRGIANTAVLESIVVKAPNLTTVEGYAFYQVKGLKVLDLSETAITEINSSYAMYNCHPSLQVYLPDTVESYANDTHRDTWVKIYWNGTLESWQALGKTETVLNQKAATNDRVEVFYLDANGDWVEYEDGSLPAPTT